jgi:hypothetical protein
MKESQIQAKKIKELESQGYYVVKLVKTLFFNLFLIHLYLQSLTCKEKYLV